MSINPASNSILKTMRRSKEWVFPCLPCCAPGLADRPSFLNTKKEQLGAAAVAVLPPCWHNGSMRCVHREPRSDLKAALSAVHFPAVILCLAARAKLRLPCRSGGKYDSHWRCHLDRCLTKKKCKWQMRA